MPWEVSALPWLIATFENQKASGVDISLTEECAPPHLYGVVPVTPTSTLYHLPLISLTTSGVPQELFSGKATRSGVPPTSIPSLPPLILAGGVCQDVLKSAKRSNPQGTPCSAPHLQTWEAGCTGWQAALRACLAPSEGPRAPKELFSPPYLRAALKAELLSFLLVLVPEWG